MRATTGAAWLIGSVWSAALLAQAAPSGEELFAQHCAACHLNPVEDDIPTRTAMGALAPNAIVDSLTDGTMRLQGQALTPAQRVAIAELVTGRPVLAASAPAQQGRCTAAAPFGTPSAGSLWNGWGPDVRNTRHQADAGGITAANVANLKLRWAFGAADVTQSRSQPAIVGGRLFMASQAGVVYALDPKTGCTHWTYEAQSGVRTAISVGPVGPANAPTGYAVYFADAQARAYAVDAATGRELWTRKVDDHAAARATGAPTLHDGRLYVPTSGVSEETAAAMPDYECCTFRGSLTALDATTGEVVWKTYTVDEPQRRGTSTSGKPLWGPAGSPIWSAPTIDEKRGLIYAATGNAYADPPPRTSDAIVAFEIATGRIRWVNQIMPDVWILGCGNQPAGNDIEPEENPNCPEDVGPDFDFSASPVLVTLANGRDALVVTQKSGIAYLLDPARRGREIWQYRWGRGSSLGGVWGATADDRHAYFAVADQRTPAPGGLHAVDLATGKRVWFAPPQTPVCAAGPGCSPAQSAALTSIEGVVFSGGADGAVRAYASDDGRVLWTFDTNRDFTTVNGVKANGGSIDGPGPVVAGGMLYVTAGNGGIVGMPGNVLLAFEL
jgi:polyvinyl alcohol dehydrogenase (cytochrome)